MILDFWIIYTFHCLGSHAGVIPTVLFILLAMFIISCCHFVPQPRHEIVAMDDAVRGVSLGPSLGDFDSHGLDDKAWLMGSGDTYSSRTNPNQEVGQKNTKYESLSNSSLSVSTINGKK